jgi:transcriptional regulator with XRE-family HTH domain
MTLTEIRRSLSMSLGECARAALTTPVELSKIERGAKAPTDDEVLLIGKVLGLDASEVRTSLPSPEEVAENYARASDGLLCMCAAMEDAKKRGLKKGNGGAGEIECPVCKGRLRYSCASTNGHVWGACLTKGCARWMQ